MIDYQLTGKTAIVTGGVSGIGLAVAQTLAASGARISVWDLKQGAVDATVAQLQDSGVQAIGVALDVTDDAAVEAAVQRTVKELGGVHVAVNNAGISGPAASSGDYPVDGWQRVIDVNLTSVFLCQRAQIQAMRAAGSGGSIINMASILGQVGYAGSTAYVAAKHGVVGLTKVVGLETATSNVTCNAICPGWVLTPLVQKQIDDRAANGGDPLQAQHDLLAEKQPSLAFVTPEHLGELVLFLCSEAGSQVRGAAWNVDGGWLAQ